MFAHDGGADIPAASPLQPVTPLLRHLQASRLHDNPSLACPIGECAALATVLATTGSGRKQNVCFGQVAQESGQQKSSCPWLLSAQLINEEPIYKFRIFFTCSMNARSFGDTCDRCG
jgi:hypothetical protein